MSTADLVTVGFGALVTVLHLAGRTWRPTRTVTVRHNLNRGWR